MFWIKNLGSAWLITVLGSAAFGAGNAVAAEPQFDLYLVQLKNQQLQQSKKLNEFSGYHNQPQFSPDGKKLYWTVARTDLQQQQTDIRQLDLASGQQSWFSTAPVSEFSPTPLTNGPGLSSVVVEADGTQRLYRLLPDQPPAVLLKDSVGVGYHAWSSQQQLAMFILGPDEQHHILRLQDSSGKQQDVTDGIGRGLNWQPASATLYFTRLQAEQLALYSYNSQNDKMSDALVVMPKSAQDIFWLNEKTLLTSAGQQLWQWQPGQQSWLPWLDLSTVCKGQVSRFSFTADRQTLALVCQRGDQ